MKGKPMYTKLFNMLLMAAAYGFLGYKIYTYDNYAGLWNSFVQADVKQWLSLIFCIILFPVNRFFEAWKWQYLVRGIEPMNLWEAQRQTYYGTLAGFITPYKIGEYPGRAMLFRYASQNWLTATCLGLIGGYAMTTIIVMFGLPSALYWLTPSQSGLAGLLLTLTMALVAIFALPAIMRRLRQRTWQTERARQLVENIADLQVRDILTLLGISLLRYTCFIVQLSLVLYFCGVTLECESLIITLPLYYMMITVTPNVPAAEVAVRGVWAVVIFERFGQDISAAATIAAMLVWAINTIFPLIVGSCVSHKRKDE